MAAPAGVRELLLRAHSLLDERSRGDPGLSRCRYHLDQCLAALESVMPFAEYAPPEGSGSSPHCCSAQAGCPSSTQSTQTVSTVVADAVSQANPTQAEQGSQVGRITLSPSSLFFSLPYPLPHPRGPHNILIFHVSTAPL